MPVEIKHTEWKDFKVCGFSRIGNIVRLDNQVVVTFLPWSNFRIYPKFILDYTKITKIKSNEI